MGIDYARTDPSRIPRSRKTGPSVGDVTDHVRRRRHGFDSENERTVITVIASFSSVRSIREQVKVAYRRDGTMHVYFIDLVVEHRCGQRKAYAVKQNAAAALEDETRTKLRLLGEQDTEGFADDYRLVTFEGLDPVAVVNASLIARCAEAQDHEAWEAVRKVLPMLPPVATATEIGRASGYDVRGMRAAFALIPAGLLRNPPGQRLHMDTPLTNGASLRIANQAA